MLIFDLARGVTNIINIRYLWDIGVSLLAALTESVKNNEIFNLNVVFFNGQFRPSLITKF